MRPVAGSHSNLINDAPTIDEVGGENCPSLKAYWKFSDGDYVNGVIPDHSGNGFDLVATSTFDAEPIGTRNFTEGDGYLIDDGYMVTEFAWAFATADLTGTDLMPDNRFMVSAISNFKQDSITDNDRGSAWLPVGGPHPQPSDIGAFTGFNWGETAAVNILRLVVNGNSDAQVALLGFDPVGAHSHCAMSYNPSTEVFGAQSVISQGEETKFETGSDVTDVPATMGVQNNRIGFRNSNSNVNALTRGTKDCQVWYFDTEPPYMKETVEWLAKNPGRIPTWWIGR